MIYVIFALTCVWLYLSYKDITQSLTIQKLGGVEGNIFLGPHPKPSKLKTFGYLSTLVWTAIALWIVWKGGPDIYGEIVVLLSFSCFLRLWMVVRNVRVKKEQEAINRGETLGD